MKSYSEVLMKKFEEANSLLANNNWYVEIVIVGGAAFILKKLVDRVTHDVDSLQFVTEEKMMQ